MAELFHGLYVLSLGVANYIFVLHVPLDSDQGLAHYHSSLRLRVLCHAHWWGRILFFVPR